MIFLVESNWIGSSIFGCLGPRKMSMCLFGQLFSNKNIFWLKLHLPKYTENFLIIWPNKLRRRSSGVRSYIMKNQKISRISSEGQLTLNCWTIFPRLNFSQLFLCHDWWIFHLFYRNHWIETNNGRYLGSFALKVLIFYLRLERTKISWFTRNVLSYW